MYLWNNTCMSVINKNLCCFFSIVLIKKNSVTFKLATVLLGYFCEIKKKTLILMWTFENSYVNEYVPMFEFLCVFSQQKCCQPQDIGTENWFCPLTSHCLFFNSFNECTQTISNIYFHINMNEFCCCLHACMYMF